MSRLRIALTIGVLAILVAALSGCVRISSTSTNQPASMGPVTLAVNFCANGSPGCDGVTNAISAYDFLDSANSDEVLNTQVLFAVRLPDGVIPGDPPAAAGLAWSRSTSYEAELQTLEPAPQGQRWWGWISNAISYSRNSTQASSVSVTVALPRPASGGAYPTPLIWRPVIGSRYGQHPSLNATRPVDCGNSNEELYDGFNEPPVSPGVASETTVCIDSPSPDAARGFLQATITDFGITGVTTEIGPAGGRIGVPFVVERSGPANPADNFANFTLSVGGGPPGSSVSLNTTTAPLISPATSVIATLDVPPNTAPGDYPITLQANAPGKPARSTAAILRVTAPPPVTPPTTPGSTTPPPAADTTAPMISSLRISKNPFRRTTLRPVNLTTRSTEGGTLVVLVQRLLPGRRVGSACRTTARTGRACQVIKRIRTVRRATTGVAAVKLAGRGITRLAPGRYRAEVRVTDAAGNRSAPKRLTFTVRP